MSISGAGNHHGGAGEHYGPKIRIPCRKVPPKHTYFVFHHFGGNLYPPPPCWMGINGRGTTMAGRMNNIDKKFEFLAEKYPQSIHLLFSTILAVSCTPPPPPCCMGIYGAMDNTDKNFESLAVKYPQSIHIFFSTILAVIYTPLHPARWV